MTDVRPILPPAISPLYGPPHQQRSPLIADHGTIGFQLDLFAIPERIVGARGGAVVNPVRRRMAGQLPWRRKHRSAGDENRQLQLSFGEPRGALNATGPSLSITRHQ